MSDDEMGSGEVPRPIVIGTGLVALDIVFGPNGGESLGRWAGGTCGNVLTILSCFGWASYPVARLADDEHALILRQDLSSWGVHLDYIYQGAFGSTPIIVQYIRRDERSAIIHRFSFKCPVCGHHLPGFRPIPARDVRRIITKMPRPQVFFFDRCSRSAIEMAAWFRASGAIVVFEPSSQGDTSLFEQALGLAHIVKYSHERLSGREAIGPGDENWLFIETLGQDGLNFLCRLPRYNTKGWEHMPSLPVEQYKDAAGAGDWCTAGLIACLGANGAEGMKQHGEEEIRFALQRGQSLAAWNCGYEGARGGMYSTQGEKLEELARTIAPTFTLRLEPRELHKARNGQATGTLPKCCRQSHMHIL
ncbi:MAG: PfkB family carbohydrate kinase [Isosphaeraceae bacterium]